MWCEINPFWQQETIGSMTWSYRRAPKLFQKHFPNRRLWRLSGGLFIHYSFLESNRSIADKIYCQRLDQTHIPLSKMRQALVNRRGSIPASWQGSVICQDDTAEDHQLGIRDPQYSPDLSSYYIFNWQNPQNISLQRKCIQRFIAIYTFTVLS